MKINPVRRWIVAVCELYCAHFANDHGAGVYKELHRRAGFVPWKVEVVEGAVAAACAEAFEVEDIFYAEAELDGWY